MCWHSLRVINDDIQQPGHMVPYHEHKNYDILGYMVSGELEHQDNLGNCARATVGQIQHMWCGSSIWHSEASVGTVPARYLQIWLTPDSMHFNTEPYYEIIDKSLQYGPLDIKLKNYMQMHAGELAGHHVLPAGSTSYLYVISGTVVASNCELHEGDAVEFDSDFAAEFAAHVILFTVPKNA